MPNIALIDDVLAKVIAGGAIPGLVAAAADQSGVIFQSAFGRRDVNQPRPMSVDCVFSIASMTKAITGAAAMQMVEQEKLSLDQPAREILPFLAETKVLEGFDSDGTPRLRAPRGEITLRRLLTHTAGFVYDIWNADLARYAAATGLLSARTGKLAALTAPLGFDPGERWEYGINIDIAGRMVEVVSGLDLETYMQRHIFAPLRMVDTSFIQRPEWDGRLPAVHARQADGSLQPLATSEAPVTPEPREFFPGGGGLLSTTADYLRFLQALMHGGVLDGQRILRPEIRRHDGSEPHGRAERAADEKRQSAVVERRGAVPRHAEEMGPQLPDQHARRTGRPQRRQPGLGGTVQHVLLARSGTKSGGRADDADPAVCRPGGAGRAGRVRERCLPGDLTANFASGHFG